MRPSIDAVALGEGDFLLAEVVSCLAAGEDLSRVPGLALNTETGQAFTPTRPPLRDLNTLPSPARHLVKRYRRYYHLGLQSPLATIQTTRGCPFRCKFCSVWQFYDRQVRFQTPSHVMKELAEIKQRFVFFNDDNFFIDPERSRKLAHLLIEADLNKYITIQARSDAIVKHPDLVSLWKRAGLRTVFVGFEKIDDEGLGDIDKQNRVDNNEKCLEVLRRNGVQVIASFIVDPWYDRLDFQKLRDYVRKFNISIPSFTILTPLPGTDLYRDLKEKLITGNYELFDMIHAVLPTKLPLEDFYGEVIRLYKASYIRAGYLSKTLPPLFRRFLTGRITPTQIVRLLSVASMFLNVRCYLSAHKKEALLADGGRRV